MVPSRGQLKRHTVPVSITADFVPTLPLDETLCVSTRWSCCPAPFEQLRRTAMPLENTSMNYLQDRCVIYILYMLRTRVLRIVFGAEVFICCRCDYDGLSNVARCRIKFSA